MRRSAPVVVVAVGLCALLASYVWYTQDVVNSLQSEAAQTSAIYARVLRANTDTTKEAANLALLDLIDAIKKLRVPVVLTSADGKFVASANIPDGADPLVYAATLDAQNRPVVQESVGTVHFGNTPLINGMRVIPLLQVGVLVILMFAGVSVLLSRGRADRESVFAGMARESAHQLGTPLSSLHGWIELLRERGPVRLWRSTTKPRKARAGDTHHHITVGEESRFCLMRDRESAVMAFDATFLQHKPATTGTTQGA